MELNDALQKRRSIRKFKNIKVEGEKLDKILEAARICQSAKNRQPWKFMILENNNKDEIADAIINKCNTIQLPKSDSCKASAKSIKNAPVLILVFREKNNTYCFNGENEDDISITSDLLSIGAAIENMCLEATNLGLGSLWIRDIMIVADEVVEPDLFLHLELVSAVAIGYADEDPQARSRKRMEEILLKY